MRCLLRILSALLIFGLVLPVRSATATVPLGVVVAARQAKVGDTAAIRGSTVFQGDRLATAETGELQIRFGDTRARFLPGSLVEISRTADGVNAHLLSGSVSLAAAAGENFSLRANQAVVRPAASQAVVAQVTRVSPGELLLSSSTGALEVTVDGEVTTLAAGGSYRMLLDSAAAAQIPAGRSSTGISKKRVVFIALGAAAAMTGIAIAAINSSSSPVSPSAP